MGREPLPGNTGGDLGLREPVHETTTDSRTGENEGGDNSVHASPCHRPGMDARGVPADAQGWSIRHRLTDPDVRLSPHPARATQRRLAPSGERAGASGTESVTAGMKGRL